MKKTRQINELALKLFRSVLEGKSSQLYVDNKHGVVCEPNTNYALVEIKEYLKNSTLTGNELNKTFHKSWDKIKKSSRFELLVEQITHYLSTYGTDFTSEIYIPDEVLNVPETKLKYVVIKGLSKDELQEKALGMLRSGIALKEETLNDVLSLLLYLDYAFKSVDDIRNKEAVIRIIERYNVKPSNPVEVLRYVIYKSTESTLLIKNKKSVDTIKESSYNPEKYFSEYGVEKLASIFNRFKPLFLAYKSKCPTVINKISKLSKTKHKPMPSNPLNLVTSEVLKNTKSLDKSTIYAVFKALNACHSRVCGQDMFTYAIRNGKSYTKENESNVDVCNQNFNKLSKYILKRLSFDKKVYIPSHVQYALPTSEKMFVGDVPTGTTISANVLNVGVYWDNAWGARDLDLSALDCYGSKVGWNADYNNGGIYYSGDITSAPNGAIEYLRFGKNTNDTWLVYLNVYSGNDESGYKIVVGDGPKASKEYMMNPNKVVYETTCTTPQRSVIVGMYHGKSKQFRFLNLGAGMMMVSKGGVSTTDKITSLTQQWENSVTLNSLLEEAGCLVTDKSEADLDLSPSVITKDTFIDLFNED